LARTIAVRFRCQCRRRVLRPWKFEPEQSESRGAGSAKVVTSLSTHATNQADAGHDRARRPTTWRR
jgi:hypothetical protein